jgi:hypothetical protein
VLSCCTATSYFIPLRIYGRRHDASEAARATPHPARLPGPGRGLFSPRAQCRARRQVSRFTTPRSDSPGVRRRASDAASPTQPPSRPGASRRRCRWRSCRPFASVIGTTWCTTNPNFVAVTTFRPPDFAQGDNPNAFGAEATRLVTRDFLQPIPDHRPRTRLEKQHPRDVVHRIHRLLLLA